MPKQAKCQIGTALPLLGPPRSPLCDGWRRGSESARSDEVFETKLPDSPSYSSTTWS